jgi:hypothetical protein
MRPVDVLPVTHGFQVCWVAALPVRARAGRAVSVVVAGVVYVLAVGDDAELVLVCDPVR